jgi:hypothetical protein
MQYQKVREKQFLVRDPINKAILNQDTVGLNKYKEEREHKMKVARVVEEHEKLKEDVSEIKQMLQTLLQRA